MKRAFWTAIVAGIVLVSCVAFVMHIEHRRSTRRQLLLTEASIRTLFDYEGDTSWGLADLTARAQLDILDVESLNTQETEVRAALREYLRAVESAGSSHSIETLQIRQPIAIEAQKKAALAMIPIYSEWEGKYGDL